MNKNILFLVSLFLFTACSTLIKERQPAQSDPSAENIELASESPENVAELVPEIIPEVTPEVAPNLNAGGGELYIIQAPARSYVNWETPSKLLSSYLKSKFLQQTSQLIAGKRTTAMGHGMVHFKCSTPSKEYNVWTGITGAHTPTDGLSLKDGMALLFKNYDDGHFQTNDEVVRLISDYRGRKEKSDNGEKFRLIPRFIKYKINAEQCESIGKFYEKYASIQLGTPTVEDLRQRAPADKLYYGFMIDPYAVWQEYLKDPTQEIYFGGGCTSIATSFAKVAGVYLPSFDKFFLRDLVVSKDYMENYGVHKFLLKNVKKWGSDTREENEYLSIYDPEKMWRFVDGVMSCIQQDTKNSFTPVMAGTCTPEVREWMSGLSGAITRTKLNEVETITSGKKKHRGEHEINIEGIEIDLSKVPEVPLMMVK